MGCYIWYSEEGTKLAITVLLYNGPLLCGFNVTINGLKRTKELYEWCDFWHTWADLLRVHTSVSFIYISCASVAIWRIRISQTLHRSDISRYFSEIQ